MHNLSQPPKKISINPAEATIASIGNKKPDPHFKQCGAGLKPKGIIL